MKKIRKTTKKMFLSLISVFLIVSMLFSGFVVKANENPEKQLINVAERGIAEASQVTTDNNTSGPEHINDGLVSLNSFWDSGKKAGKEVYVILDLQKEYDIEEIRLFNYWNPIYGTNIQRWYKYEIYTSIDKENWKLVAIKDNEEVVTKEGDLYQFETPQTARYVKVNCLGSNVSDNITHIVELQVFAQPEETEVNIALNKPVNAVAGQASLITDGEKSKYWDGGVGPQFFVIDLQDYYKLSSLRAYPYWLDGRHYHYEIYASDNGFNWDKIAEKNNNQPETSQGTLFTVDSDVVARYIRVNMTYNSVNTSVHMNEFEVYGTKQAGYIPTVPTDKEDAANIAFAKVTRSNSGKNISNFAVDGNTDTGWSTFTFPSNLDIDLGKNYNLSDMTLYFPVSDHRYYQYTVYTSIDGINFERLIQKRNHDVVDETGDTYQVENKEARYVRVNVEFVSEGEAACINEIKIHGSESDTPSIDRKELNIPAFEGSGYDTPITAKETIDEVYALVERCLGKEYCNWFEFEIVENEKDEDFFEIVNHDEKILIRGNKGVSITTGLNYYLKYFCKVQITQQTKQVNSMPKVVVPVDKAIYKATPLTVRYAYNYCTLSYTNAFYGEEEWQRELDWLALNGVNVILDTTGQEAVWVDFLQKIGYSTADAQAWLVGPAYSAWQLMSNMENFGGPINDQYILDRLELARKNQRKMRALGISPVLQGYSGMIPSDYEKVVDDKEKYQDIIDAMMPQGTWGGQFIRPDMLKTNSQVFQKCADMFYESQRKVLGNISSYYAIDPFHEGGIPPTDMGKDEISATVLAKMMEHDPNAVWMIQSWEGNPTKGLLDGLGDYREDHAIILDLSATTAPHFNNSTWGEEFYGTSWIYCMLDNFGDRPGVHGELEVIATEVIKARQNSQHMKGIGITPEGTKLNPVNYELFFETAWEEEINLDQWIKDYVERRYGSYSESAYQGWLKLLDTAYGSHGGHWGGVNSIANYQPGMSLILGSNKAIPYNTRLFDLGVEQILKDYDKLSSNESYLYDVAALLQQQLQNSQLIYYQNFEKAYRENNLEDFNKNAKLFLDSISIVDEVMATQEDGLLGTWIGKAFDRSKDYDDFSQDIFDFNAKSLITTWGGRKSAKTLGDYAYRQYSGLENDYVKPRWEKYIKSKYEVLANNAEYQEITYDEYFNDMWDFILSDKTYSRETTDTKSELKRLAKIVADNYTVDQEKVVTDDNIAINGFVSSDQGGNNLNAAIDDNDKTLWVAGSTKVPSTLKLNLGEEKPVYQIQTVFEKDPAVSRGLYIGFKVEVFTNGEWLEVLKDKTSNEKQTFDIFFDIPEKISEVRVVITSVDGSLWPAVAELRVYSSKGIQILDTDLLERKDDKILINEADTVSNIKSKLSADVGDIVFYHNGEVMNDNDMVTANCDVKLIISNIVVDVLKIEIKVDKDALGKLIEESLQLSEKDYTASSWLEFQKVLSDTKDLYINEEATQEEIDQALENLQKAYADLVLITVDSNKTVLSIAIEMAENADLEKVVPAVVEEFNAALANAKAVYDDAKATQEEVDNAFDRLANVMHMLQFFKGDKTALQKQVDQINALEVSNYIESTWQALLPVLDKANDVLANINAMQEEVDEVYTELVKAFLDLRLKPNKDLLQELINKVQTLNAANYSANTWSAVANALDKAVNVLNDSEASQKDVDNAKDVLTKAIAGLQTVNTVKSGDTTTSVKTGDNSMTGLFTGLSLLSVAILLSNYRKRKIM